MQRFRFGLGGLGGPLTERELYGTTPVEQRLQVYGDSFAAYEMNVSRFDEFSHSQAESVAARLPPHVHIIPRIHRHVTDGRWGTDASRQALEGWLSAVQPILRCDHRGPIFIPWTGPRTPRSEDALHDLLSTLWPRLPGRQRIAVEFRDRSWFRASPIHMLEENGAGLVWSTLAGTVPYRVTADFLYIRLTGPNRRIADEVTALADRVRARRYDERPVYVVSTRHHEPYGLHALRRFADAVGHPIEIGPRRAHPAHGQSALDSYATVPGGARTSA